MCRMNNLNVLIWNIGVDDVLDGVKVAGIPLQLSMWCRTFLSTGWNVFCLTGRESSYKNHNIQFEKVKVEKLLSLIHLSVLGKILAYSKLIKRIKPYCIIMRGSTGELLLMTCLCRVNKVKLIFLGASDNDFVPGKEYVAKRKIEMYRYQLGLKYTNYFVCQNEFQRKNLLEHYGKESIIIPNISNLSLSYSNIKRFDAVWVSNMWPIKRTEMFLKMAETLPDYKFAIIGGAIDKTYFEKIKAKAETIPNIAFLGSRSFEETTDVIASSRVLVCTSEFEGFPNTFIQAWSRCVPVISTVDPNQVVSTYKIGSVVSTQENLISAFVRMVKDQTFYESCVKAIEMYYLNSHSADKAYEKLMDFIK